jgi:hypothetical protein
MTKSNQPAAEPPVDPAAQGASGAAPEANTPATQAGETPEQFGNPTVTPLVENWHDGGFIVSEANGHLSRDGITLTGGAFIMAGTVLGLVTASGNFAPLNPAAADGSQTAAGILFGGRDTTTANQPAVAITRNAEVNGNELVWPTGITPAQITTATAQLKALNILVR